MVPGQEAWLELGAAYLLAGLTPNAATNNFWRIRSVAVTEDIARWLTGSLPSE